jgi:predicted hydrocarbon binding protein
VTQLDSKRTMEFPERSNRTTDEKFTWDEVRERLDEEFMNRANYTARILLALREKFGDEVFDVAKKVIYEIGCEMGERHAATAKEKSLEHLLEIFSRKIDVLYFGFTAELLDDKFVGRAEHCPMPRQWKQMGMTDEEIVHFCSIFDHVDKGVIEGYSERYTGVNTGCRTLAEKGYCQLTAIEKS